MTHALQVLQFDKALGAVAAKAGSELGADEVRARTPSADRTWVTAELGRVEAAMAVIEADDGWSMPNVPDVREALSRLRIAGAVLSAGELARLALLLASSRAAGVALHGAGDGDADPSLLQPLVHRLVAEPALEREIGVAVDADGTVRNDASPELSRLRRRIRDIRGGIVDRLTRFAQALPEAIRVPDASVTVREGRYVVPVRREGRGVVGGMVHAESASGGTLFVEPPEATAVMSRLREAEAAEAREVQRILRTLTGAVRPLRQPLAGALEALIQLDSLFARAHYARSFGAAVPVVAEGGADKLRIVQGRHPVLLASGADVVPFDLTMGVGERTLLLSGPNTGGKTVLLAAVGLISLLAQSGVVPPVGAGTRLPVFREIFADIGDEQSIQASLSTFSAHLRNLREPLERAGESSLVLIDEIGTGTDPTEGAALARAVLTTLARRGCLTLASTHLGALKLLAEEERGVSNASLHFDAERMEPTYRLVKGVPGRSYGLAMARRLGLPEEVLDEAENYLPEGERDVARLLASLEAREAAVIREREELARARAKAERAGAEIQRRQDALGQREEHAERRARQQARDLLLQARGEVEAAIREVRGAADAGNGEEAVRAARRRVERAADRQRERTPDRATPRRSRQVSGSEAPLEVGATVRIEAIGRTGTLTEVRDGRARVEAGGVRMELPIGDLTVVDAPERPAGPRRSGGPGAGDYLAPRADARPEVDVRGRRVDEMEGEFTRALDAAVVAGLRQFRVIHGKGTGALRERVGELLDADARVASFRPGERGEGGTGVTVAEFA